MGSETERKFLTNKHLKTALSGVHGSIIKQGYIATNPGRTVRIRIADEKAWITIKGKAEKLTRPEFEYEIPVADAEEMLRLFAENFIEKKRYVIPFEGNNWEVDVFEGDNEGLIIAEIELDSEEEEFIVPGWVEMEVTGDSRYFNSYLVKNAYKFWKTDK